MNILCEDRGLTEIEAGEFLGLHPATLRKMRCIGNRPGLLPCPPYYKFGKAIRYSLFELQDYRAAHRVTDGGEAA
tara:strand:+ start:128 stop:352 length:225 start_codon:yes stop_codon:yes gene_type:complete